MDNSWVSNTSSTGFVYFQIDTTPSKHESSTTETSDFAPHLDRNPSPQIQRFNPSSFSSPQNFRRGSPRNFHRRGWKQNYGNRSYSPNRSYNSSYNSSRNRTRDTYQSFNSMNGSFSKFSVQTYSSFLEDPWANLERQLEQQKRQNESSSSNQVEQSSNTAGCDSIEKKKEQPT